MLDVLPIVLLKRLITPISDLVHELIVRVVEHVVDLLLLFGEAFQRFSSFLVHLDSLLVLLLDLLALLFLQLELTLLVPFLSCCLVCNLVIELRSLSICFELLDLLCCLVLQQLYQLCGLIAFCTLAW